MLIYFLKGSLPWQNVKAKSRKEKYDKIKEIKENLNFEDLGSGIPGNSLLIIKFMKNRGIH